MSDNVKKKAQTHPVSEEMTVNRMMLLFVAATVAVVILLLVGKGGAAERFFVHSLLLYFQIASAALVLAAAVFYFAGRGKDESGKLVTRGGLLAAAALLFVVLISYIHVGSGVRVALVIALTVLCFVKTFYQKDFFIYSALTFLNVVSLFAVRAALTSALWKDSLIWLFRGLGILVPVAVIIAALLARKNGGVLALGGKKRHVLGEGALYSPFFIGSAVTLCGAAAGLFLSSIAVYAAIAALALFLVYAIVYTVKMM